MLLVVLNPSRRHYPVIPTSPFKPSKTIRIFSSDVNFRRVWRRISFTTDAGPDACSTRSLPAQEIEDFVVEQIKRIGQDPELADQVFDEAVKQQKLQRQRLKKEYKRLQKERQQRGEEIKRLVGAIAGSDAPSPSLTQRLSEIEHNVGCLDNRLLELKGALTDQSTTTVKQADVRTALREFMPVWDQLKDPERVRLLGLILQCVTFESGTVIVAL